MGGFLSLLDVGMHRSDIFRIRSFSVDRVSVRRDRSNSDIVCILFCVIVKPHESTKAL